ncbi:hypothetical protein GCM10019060_31100 [Novosphingobium pokkalii]|nr:hypothetical protein GCM10019060_31100 [Novosphingobium pokkalii]
MTSLSTTIARFVVPPGRWLAGAFALSLALSLAMPTSALGAEPHRIVLLGARWCAPCMAEYANLPALVRAAAPDRVVLAWIDRPIAVPAGLQGQVDSLPAPAARALAEHELGVGFGLPAALAPGRGCPPWRGPLHPTDLATWRSHCAGAAH